MNKLKAIAIINEEIKGIVSVAENISLTATNAMLVARQAGNQAVGFTMVVRELRLYSEKMAATMQSLTQQIYAQVAMNARQRNQLRKQALLNRAGTAGGLAQLRIASACLHSQREIDAAEQLMADQMRTLRTHIRRTGKQCASGTIIARSACIEAAYGGAMSLVLHQIAEDVETVVNRIIERAKTLELQLAGIQNHEKSNGHLPKRLPSMDSGSARSGAAELPDRHQRVPDHRRQHRAADRSGRVGNLPGGVLGDL